MATTVIEDFEGTPSLECPYSGKKCWVGTNEDASEHLFATGVYLGGSEPWSRLDELVDEKSKQIIAAFFDREIEEQSAIIEKVGGKAGETLDALRNCRLWWTDFVESEVFEAEIDEAKFSTIYYSAFVPDVGAALEILVPRFLAAAEAAIEVGRREYLFYLRPEHVEKLDGRLSIIGGKDLDRVSVGDRLWVISKQGGRFLLIGSILAECIMDSFDMKWGFEGTVPFEADYYVLAAEGEAPAENEIEIEETLRQLHFAEGKAMQLPEKLTARNFQSLKLLTRESSDLLARA